MMGNDSISQQEEKVGKTAASSPVLKLENVAISYQTRTGDIPAVRDVSLEIHQGETFGLVGESGCGKSTVAFGIVNFLGRNGRIVNGKILFQGQELVEQSPKALRKLCGNQIAMVYQDPAQALNPSLRIGTLLTEALTVHQKIDQETAYQKSLAMLKRVYMPDPETVMLRYPHQLSGGQKQRVVIAIALLNNPALLIMDEPTTALDVTVEAAVLDLISDLRQEFNTAILYISHNMGVIARIADHVGVMYAGEIVEHATVQEIFAHPHHPYTRSLVACVPQLGMTKQKQALYPIRGRVPSPKNLPAGCVYGPRCDFIQPRCQQDRPDLISSNGTSLVRCWFVQEINDGHILPPVRQDDVPAIQCSTPDQQLLLNIEQARTYYEQSSNSLKSLFGLERKQYVKAVDGIDLRMSRGCTLGVVGESGCGKSTLAKTIVGLEPLTDGKIDFLGFDISVPVRKRDTDLIREIQMVFQNPDATLNPSFKIGYQIGRPLQCFNTVPRNEVRDVVIRLLHSVRLGPRYYDRLPRQLSGGEKQRVAIARALAGQPELVVCDEPVSALDVSVQAAVLNLLLQIQADLGTALLFIAHDLSVVRYISDTIAVMYLGKICEFGPADLIYSPPYHPYTEALLSAVPIPNPNIEQKRIRLTGSVPSALNPPPGCRFNTRCPRKVGEICEQEEPPAQKTADGHWIYCHIPLEELSRVEPVIQVKQS